mgnify:CR=1 FL=1
MYPILFFLLLFSALEASKADEVLTLGKAIEIALSSPNYLQRNVVYDMAMAQLEKARTDSKIQTRLDASVYDIGTFSNNEALKKAIKDSNGNHWATKLVVTKHIWDKKTDYNIHSLEFEELAAKVRHSYYRSRLRIDVIRNYFDLLLAKTAKQVATETRSTYFMSFVTAQLMYDAGQLTPADLNMSIAEDASKLSIREQSKIDVIMAAERLAELMGVKEVSENLEEPVLNDKIIDLPSFELLYDMMIKRNQEVIAYDNLIAAAKARVNGVAAKYGPEVSLNLEIGNLGPPYLPDSHYYGNINLSWPLLDSTRKMKDVDVSELAVSKLKIDRDIFIRELRRSLQERYLKLQYLQTIERDARRAEVSFREFALEKSRVEHQEELETRVSLRMAELSGAQLNYKRNEYNIEIEKLELELLVDRELATFDTTTH